MKEAPRQIIKHSLEDPKLEIGDTISIREGVTGVVLARYNPAGEQNQICYVVELLPDDGKKGHRD